MFSGDVVGFVEGLRAARDFDVSQLVFETLPSEILHEVRADLARMVRLFEAANIASLQVLDARRAEPAPPPADPAPQPDAAGEPAPAPPPPPPPPPVDDKRARRDTRIARGLDRLPHTKAAFDAGRLSIEQVSQLVHLSSDLGVGSSFVDNERSLLDAVLAGRPDQTGQIIRDWRGRNGAEQRDAKARHRRRSTRTWHDDDGFTHLHFAGADGYGGQVGSLFGTLLDADWTRRTTALPDTPMDERTRDQRAADVLSWALELAVSALDDGAARPKPRATMLVTIDHDDLVNAGGGTDTRSGAPVSAADIRKLCCDAGIARIVTRGESVPLDKGRAVRLATTEQRQALAAHFATCIRPGCSVPFWWTQIHHIDEFVAEMGETNLADLAPLCNVDHDLAHHGGHRIERGDTPGELIWVTADGVRYPIRAQPPNPPRPAHEPPSGSPNQLGLAV